MSENSGSASLHTEMRELYQRARRAINESHALAADGEFIRWWCRMRRHPEARQENMLDD
jgi:hypothetical protein